MTTFSVFCYRTNLAYFPVRAESLNIIDLFALRSNFERSRLVVSKSAPLLRAISNASKNYHSLSVAVAAVGAFAGGENASGNSTASASMDSKRFGAR